MSDDGKCYAATPAATLEGHILNSNIAKSETEWWAHREITRLRSALAAVTAERDRLREALEFYGWAEHWVKQPYERSVIEDDKGRRARAAIEGVKEPASPWRGIESAPKDGNVLVLGKMRDGNYYQEVSKYFYAKNCWPVIFMDGYLAPTHWMPLPEPPR